MDILAIASQTDEKPEQPEVLAIIRESKQFGTPYWDAPLRQWPWYLKLEVSEMYRAEYDHEERITFNLNQKAKLLEKSLNNNGS